LVPPLLGFKHYLASNIRLGPELVRRGLFVTRFQIDEYALTITAGFNEKPAHKEDYLSILGIQWVDPTGKGPSPGLVLEGDPFSRNASQGSGKVLWSSSSGEIPFLQKAGFLLDLIVKTWQKGGLLDGNHANLRDISRFYEEGLMDLLVTAALSGSGLNEAIARSNPHSVEAFPDLDFEVGLGIDAEVEPTGTFPMEIPIAEIKEILAPGKFLYDVPKDQALRWIFYRTPKGEVVSDILKAVRYEEALNPFLKQPTAGLLSDISSIVAYRTSNGVRCISGPWAADDDPSVRTLEYVPACILRTGWHGFRMIPLSEGLLVIRNFGTYVYNSDEFYKLVERTAEPTSVLAEFPDLLDSGWAGEASPG
jgi:hypothetical protein